MEDGGGNGAGVGCHGSWISPDLLDRLPATVEERGTVDKKGHWVTLPVDNI